MHTFLLIVKAAAVFGSDFMVVRLEAVAWFLRAMTPPRLRLMEERCCRSWGMQFSDCTRAQAGGCSGGRGTGTGTCTGTCVVCGIKPAGVVAATEAAANRACCADKETPPKAP